MEDEETMIWMIRRGRERSQNHSRLFVFVPGAMSGVSETVGWPGVMERVVLVIQCPDERLGFCWCKRAQCGGTSAGGWLLVMVSPWKEMAWNLLDGRVKADKVMVKTRKQRTSWYGRGSGVEAKEVE